MQCHPQDPSWTHYLSTRPKWQTHKLIKSRKQIKIWCKEDEAADKKKKEKKQIWKGADKQITHATGGRDSLADNN